MASTLNRKQTNQGMKALFSAFFPVQASSTAGRRKGYTISRPAKARIAAATHGTTKAPSRLQQEICRTLVVVAMACTMAGVLAAYNFRDSIQAQAQQWVMAIKG